MATQELLLTTSKKMNAALAQKKYELAYSLLKIGNTLRIELGQNILTLKSLESRFSK